jgi:hypothetical protein
MFELRYQMDQNFIRIFTAARNLKSCILHIVYVSTLVNVILNRGFLFIRFNGTLFNILMRE